MNALDDLAYERGMYTLLMNTVQKYGDLTGGPNPLPKTWWRVKIVRDAYRQAQGLAMKIIMEEAYALA